MWGRHQLSPQPTSMLWQDKSWSSAVKSIKPSSKTTKEETGSDAAHRSPCIPTRILSSRTPTMEWPTYQENGQRKYGPPSWWSGPPPPKGTEVFLSRLHRQCMEDELCPILARVGTIYSFRLMMDFSGSNRGFGFAQYSAREEALRAIKELNDYPVRPGSRMTVEESMDNCRLFIGRIPKELTEAKLKKLLEKYLSGLKYVFLYMSAINKKENRGFCFVEFDDHRSAAMGRRYLLCSGIPEWRNIDITVDWAVPETNSPRVTTDKIMTIYVRNLKASSSVADIKKLLDSFTINLKFVSNIKKLKDSAFIQFASNIVAEYALNRLDGAILHGSRLLATWAKPPLHISNGEYYSHNADHFNEGAIESGCSSRRDSLDSTNSISSCNPPHKGVSLLKRREKHPKTKQHLPMLATPKVNNDSTSAYSPRRVSRELFKDEGYSTDLNGSPPTPAHSSSPSRSVDAASYAPSDSNFPRIQSKRAVEERDLIDLNSDVEDDHYRHNFNFGFVEIISPRDYAYVYCDILGAEEISVITEISAPQNEVFPLCLHRAPSNAVSSSSTAGSESDETSTEDIISNITHYLAVSKIFPPMEIAPSKAEMTIIDAEMRQYLYLSELIKNMLLLFTPYEILLNVAKAFEWGTIVHSFLEYDGKWIASIGVQKGEQVQNLYVLENLCMSENIALNEAAHKFICKYLLDPEMFRVAKVLFFP